MNAKNAEIHNLEVVPPVRDEVGALDRRIFIRGRRQVEGSRTARAGFWTDLDLGGCGRTHF